MRRETLAPHAGFDRDRATKVVAAPETLRLGIGIEHINGMMANLNQASAAAYPVPTLARGVGRP